MKATVLTAENIDFIIANRLTMTGAAMARLFKVSKGVVNSYMRNHGLTPDRETKLKFKAEAIVRTTTLTAEQEKILLENYLTIPVRQLTIMIGKSRTCLLTRLDQLGIEIPLEIRESRIGNMFKSGCTSFNKGKKQTDYMSAEAIEATKKTRFKKGDLPHNAKGIKDGDVRIRHSHPDRNNPPYKWIRLEIGKWKMLHVFNWEKVKGPVPAGSIVVFKNGDTMNCDISNLECITREQHAANTREKDEYIAKTLSMRKGKKGLYDKELYQDFLKNKPLIELKKKQLELKRTIHAQQEIS